MPFAPAPDKSTIYTGNSLVVARIRMETFGDGAFFKYDCHLWNSVSYKTHFLIINLLNVIILHLLSLIFTRLGVDLAVRVASLESLSFEFEPLSAIELTPGGVDSAHHPSEVGEMSTGVLVIRGTVSAAKLHPQPMMLPAAMCCIQKRRR